MGHALQLALADTLVRWQRMRGKNVLFQPGYDHAGISTQNVVEKELAKEGKTRHDLGREAFEARVWEWLRLYGRTIMSQFRRMGASLDYRRERFTMDDDYVRAVMRFFVHLYGKGWIYRDNRIINWCPFHMTSLSDLELVHREVDDALYVRPLPACGRRRARDDRDRAAGDDPGRRRRGRAPGGRPLPGSRREGRSSSRTSSAACQVVADERVERDFGTGALKVTPGHDPLDFAIGRDHGLPEPMVIGPDGRMSEEAGDLAGLTQEEAGERILAWIREHDQLEKRESYRHSVALCERCETRIEPLISLQWWCAMEDLKKPALEALRARRVRYHPESQHRFAIESLENAPDWNISRQLWWGHQIPVWYCPNGHVTVAETDPDACAQCGSTELKREEDVLDTWFSSALWPFATLGWPDQTPDLDAFYPGTLNTTAREIIRLWENRMIFAGLEMMGDIPFEDVIIHSTVLAPDGRRMSKSLGTGIDPVEVIDKYGTDATRYGLLKMSSTQDVRFSYGVIEEGRKLTNKLWNASRLLLSGDLGEVAARPRALEEHWILARLEAVRRELEESLEEFSFAPAVGALYRLTFDDFCDWYAEAIKPQLYAGDPDTRATALAALERLLKLLHPVMPHVTEEIWSHLPSRESRLIVAPWPEPLEAAVSPDALDRVQSAAATYRRSGAPVALEGEERRIFEAVVRPKGEPNGNADAEVERLRREIARAEGMLGNQRFVSSAPEAVVEGEREKLARYRRELDALGG